MFLCDFLYFSCGNLQRCRVEPSVVLFGDSCPGTDKYLEVQFQCLQVAEEEEEERWEPRFPDTQISQLWDPSHKFISQEAVRASLSIVRNTSINVSDLEKVDTSVKDNDEDAYDASQDKEDDFPHKEDDLPHNLPRQSSKTKSDPGRKDSFEENGLNPQKPAVKTSGQEGFISRKMTVIILIVLSCVVLCLIILSYCSINIKKVNKTKFMRK